MTTTPTTPADGLLSVALVTLGCARNEVDSEELAGRLESDGFRLVDEKLDDARLFGQLAGIVGGTGGLDRFISRI